MRWILSDQDKWANIFREIIIPGIPLIIALVSSPEHSLYVSSSIYVIASGSIRTQNWLRWYSVATGLFIITLEEFTNTDFGLNFSNSAAQMIGNISKIDPEVGKTIVSYFPNIAILVILLVSVYFYGYAIFKGNELRVSPSTKILNWMMSKRTLTEEVANNLLTNGYYDAVSKENENIVLREKNKND